MGDQHPAASMWRRQGDAELWHVIERPHIAIRRLPPDVVQVQIVVGSLLGDARFEGRPGHRQIRIAHASSRAAYVWWKYERLGAFAASPPSTCDERTTFDTIVHPLFDDLASLDRPGLLRLVEPLGLAVWLADKGRLQLEIGSFLPRQRAALLRGCGAASRLICQTPNTGPSGTSRAGSFTSQRTAPRSLR